MLPFIGRPYQGPGPTRSHPSAWLATVTMIDILRQLCIERDIRLDLHRHPGDRFENRADCLSQTCRQHGHALLG
jgi:hypothetical protein